jgi:phosphatidylinositol-4,5-bisphosphate 3-kinase catalytic subunit alpha/beta/delta
LKFLFKNGDDLKQDNLVLQFFKMMDRLWIKNGWELNMVCYDVMETDQFTGYIQFVDNATVITEMHKKASHCFLGPFYQTTVRDHFVRHHNATQSLF